VSRAVLSYYESGKRQPPLPKLSALGRFYGVPLRDLLEESDRDPAAIQPAEVFFRAAQAELGSEARAAIQAFSSYADEFSSLTSELGTPPPGQGKSPFPAMRSNASRADAARWAEELRALLRLGEGPVRDLFALVAEDVLVFRLPLGSADTAPSGLFYNHEAIGFCIVVNSDMTYGRQVFTLAHELGHVYFHSGLENGGISFPNERNGRERFADAFAAEFLVPTDALHKLVDEWDVWERDFSDPLAVIHLQRQFGVSYAAMLYRLKQTRLITQATLERLQRYSPSRLAEAMGYEVHPADLGDYRLGPLDRFPDRMLRLIRRPSTSVARSCFYFSPSRRLIRASCKHGTSAPPTSSLLHDTSVARNFAVLGWTDHLVQLGGGTLRVVEGVLGIDSDDPGELEGARDFFQDSFERAQSGSPQQTAALNAVTGLDELIARRSAEVEVITPSSEQLALAVRLTDPGERVWRDGLGIRARRLDAGEAATIAVALDESEDFASDDDDARIAYTGLGGARHVWTRDLMGEAVENKLLSAQEAESGYERLRSDYSFRGPAWGD
jgi:Zn-dependent peptidase ImmA (M78 family)